MVTKNAFHPAEDFQQPGGLSRRVYDQLNCPSGRVAPYYLHLLVPIYLPDDAGDFRALPISDQTVSHSVFQSLSTITSALGHQNDAGI